MKAKECLNIPPIFLLGILKPFNQLSNEKTHPKQKNTKNLYDWYCCVDVCGANIFAIGLS